jgi:hypothetical protein
MRLSDLKQALKQHGIEVKEDGGKHPYYLKRDGVGRYPLKAHNGLKSEIKDVYLRALCKHFGIDIASLS